MAIPAPLLARFESQLQALTFILARSTPHALDARPRPDEWSARENLAHLARHHAVFLDRKRLAHPVNSQGPYHRLENSPGVVVEQDPGSPA